MDVKYLWFITTCYAMLSLLSSWFVICSISLQNFTVNAGTLLCPITLLTANLLTEIYGFKNARRAIWCGFFFNLLSYSYALLTIKLPTPSYALHNPLFNSIFIIYLNNSFFFMISYLVTESFNIFLFAKLKLKLNGYYSKLRMAGCVFLSFFINNSILSLARFFGSKICLEFFIMSFINLLITLVCLPIICFIIDKVKNLEKIDIYDLNTQFNFFKFEVQYVLSNNKFTN